MSKFFLIKQSKIFISRDQDGVTMLLAILVLSSLILVTLAVAGFTIQEVRSSRTVVLSEPAINAAETGAELALWDYNRTGNTAVPNCTGTVNGKNLSSSNATLTYCRGYSNKVYTVTSTEDTVFTLYDPDSPNVDTDLSGYPYNYVSLTNKSTQNSVDIRVARFGSDGTLISAFTLNHGDIQSISIPAVVSGAEGRVVVTMRTSTGMADVDATTDRGLPDSLNLTSNGCSSKAVTTTCATTDQELFTRKIEVDLSK